MKPFLILATVCLFSSCLPMPITYDPYVAEDRQKKNVYYVSSVPNMPLLTEQGDLRFSFLGTLASKYNGTEIQAATLPWKHIGLMGSFSTGKNDYLDYKRFELGSGYVTQLAKEWHFEFYGGLGNGKIRNYHFTGGSRTALTHYFLQPAISLTNKEQTTQIALSSRIVGVNFNVKDTLFDTDREQFSHNHLKSLYDKPFHILWEPSLVLRFGWKHFHFNVQYTVSRDLTMPDLYRAKNNLALGVSYRFNTKNNK
jgi:hypothetical protein